MFFMTNPVRIAFPHTKTVDRFTKKHCVTVVIDKNDTETITQIKNAIRAAAKEKENEGIKVNAEEQIERIFKENEEKHKNAYFFVAKSNNEPKFQDKNRNKIEVKEELKHYSYAQLGIVAQPYKIGSNTGVTMYLSIVQLDQ